jgi:CRP-like cAMP-binding protein
VLEEDPDLGEDLAQEPREWAQRACLARTLTLDKGTWAGEKLGQGIGLLVLDGLLIRRVGVEHRFGAELLGFGDLLRPWQGEDGPATLPVTSGWRVIEPVRLAVLDDAFTTRVARYPTIIERLVGRALRRARNLSINMAIVHQARVDVRLDMLLWHLAARWGRVRSDCVSLPLQLTHSVLADLAAAQRPTVTTALSELARRGRVRQGESGWMLYGNPPGELLELTPLPALHADAAPVES